MRYCSDILSCLFKLHLQLATLFEDGGEASERLAAAQERLQGSVTTASYNHKQIVIPWLCIPWIYSWNSLWILSGDKLANFMMTSITFGFTKQNFQKRQGWKEMKIGYNEFYIT